MIFPALERRARVLESGHPSTFAPSWLQGGDAYSGVSVTPENALQSAAVKCAFTILTEAVASPPLKLLQRKNGITAPVREDDRYWLLYEQPNERTGSFTFREVLQGHLLGWGNAYAEITRNGRGVPDGLWQLRPDIMEPRLVNGKLWYVYNGKTDRPVRWDEILHVPGLSWNGIEGFSPIRMAREAIALGVAAERSGAAMMGNTFQMGGVIEMPAEATPLDHEAEAKFLAHVEARMSGPAKAGRWFLAQEGAKVKELGINPDDAQYLETRKYQVGEVARIFNLAPHLLKDLERATFSNIEHQFLEHVMVSVLPWLLRWEQELNRKLLTERERRIDGLFYKFNVDGMLRGDHASRTEAARSEIASGIATPNEVRERNDQNPYNHPSADKLHMQINMAPIEDLGAMSTGERILAAAAEKRALTGEELRFLTGGGEVSPPPAPPPVEGVEFRSARSRLRLRDVFEKLMVGAVGRIVTAEIRAIRRQIDKLPTIGEAAFRAWLEVFFRDHEEFVRDVAGPVLIQYMRAVAGESLSELDGDAEAFEADLQQFSREYVAAFGTRHSQGGLRQLLEILNRDEDEETRFGLLSDRMTGWEETRTPKTSESEATQAGAAIAYAVYGFAGVSRLAWYYGGDGSCPICSRLSGRTVAYSEPIMPAGEELDLGAEKAPFQNLKAKRHPPAHRGCKNCTIVPG